MGVVRVLSVGTGMPDGGNSGALSGSLDSKEAAHYLGLHVRTLRNKIVNGEGPRHEKRFGKLLFRKADLDAYLKSVTEVRQAFR